MSEIFVVVARSNEKQADGSLLYFTHYSNGVVDVTDSNGKHVRTEYRKPVKK